MGWERADPAARSAFPRSICERGRAQGAVAGARRSHRAQGRRAASAPAGGRRYGMCTPWRSCRAASGRPKGGLPVLTTCRSAFRAPRDARRGADVWSVRGHQLGIGPMQQACAAGAMGAGGAAAAGTAAHALHSARRPRPQQHVNVQHSLYLSSKAWAAERCDLRPCTALPIGARLRRGRFCAGTLAALWCSSQQRSKPTLMEGQAMQCWLQWVCMPCRAADRSAARARCAALPAHLFLASAVAARLLVSSPFCGGG